MACSKYSYVKNFETQDSLLPCTYIVIRVDGKGFHKFCNLNNFAKPNELSAIHLMNLAAKEVMKNFREIFIAYGQSDEYSFVFRKDAQLYKRRGEKIITTLASCFTAHYILNFEKLLGKKMEGIPTFDGRWVVYPDKAILKDYLSWRQVDCHINNLYNTCFWLLVQKDGISNTEAEKILKDTVSAQKNEIMFQKGLNYNNEPDIYKKGTILLWTEEIIENKKKPKMNLEELHEDLIQPLFWEKYHASLDY